MPLRAPPPGSISRARNRRAARRCRWRAPSAHLPVNALARRARARPAHRRAVAGRAAHRVVPREARVEVELLAEEDLPRRQGIIGRNRRRRKDPELFGSQPERVRLCEWRGRRVRGLIPREACERNDNGQTGDRSGNSAHVALRDAVMEFNGIFSGRMERLGSPMFERLKGTR